MKCIGCGYDLNENANFCPKCGRKVMTTCKKCGYPLTNGTNFCTRCGMPVEENDRGEKKKKSNTGLKIRLVLVLFLIILSIGFVVIEKIYGLEQLICDIKEEKTQEKQTNSYRKDDADVQDGSDNADAESTEQGTSDEEIQEQNSNESRKMEEMLLKETGLNPLVFYYDMFEKNGTYGMIAIYQYDSEWMEKDNCQVWYCDGNNVTQLFEWENTSGNAFCSVNDVALYKNSEGYPYVILNTRQRVALSYDYCQIFGADESGMVNKVYEVEGNAVLENGRLLLNEAITELVDGIPETTIQKYDIDIIDGVVQKL